MKYAIDAVLDAPLEAIARATVMLVCNEQPMTRDEAEAMALASVPVGREDFEIGEGAFGRRLAVAEKAGVPVLAGGWATHVALCAEGLLYATTCVPQPLIAGNVVNLPAWSVYVEEPR